MQNKPSLVQFFTLSSFFFKPWLDKTLLKSKVCKCVPVNVNLFYLYCVYASHDTTRTCTWYLPFLQHSTCWNIQTMWVTNIQMPSPLNSHILIHWQFLFYIALNFCYFRFHLFCGFGESLFLLIKPEYMYFPFPKCCMTPCV